MTTNGTWEQLELFPGWDWGSKKLTAYCVSCKGYSTTDEFEVKVSDSGRRMARGRCPRCDTRINKILGKEEQL